MDLGYNFYNLEASFRNFLVAGNIKPVSLKNYLSDLRHFFGWLILKYRSTINSSSVIKSKEDFIALINLETVNQYKSYLTNNHIPEKTINRRLSTVRKFCSFCIVQGWMKENPAKKIGNIGTKKISFSSVNEILEQYRSDLAKKNLDQTTVKSYLNDISEFLSL